MIKIIDILISLLSFTSRGLCETILDSLAEKSNKAPRKVGWHLFTSPNFVWFRLDHCLMVNFKVVIFFIVSTFHVLLIF